MGRYYLYIAVGLLIWLLLLYIHHLKLRRIVGPRIAKDSLLRIALLSFFLLAPVIAFSLYFQYNLIDIFNWCWASVILSFLFLSCYRKSAEKTLLCLGRVSGANIIFGLGVIQIFIAFIKLYYFIDDLNELPLGTNSEVGLSASFLYLSLGIYGVVNSLRKLEFKEDGISSMNFFIAWARIKSYRWTPSQPKMLLIQVEPLAPFFPGFAAIKVPAKYRNDVIETLNRKLAKVGL